VSKESITTNTQIDLTENNKGIYFINIQTSNEKIEKEDYLPIEDLEQKSSLIS
jgi:hypothetical protein